MRTARETQVLFKKPNSEVDLAQEKGPEIKRRDRVSLFTREQIPR